MCFGLSVLNPRKPGIFEGFTVAYAAVSRGYFLEGLLSDAAGWGVGVGLFVYCYRF